MPKLLSFQRMGDSFSPPSFLYSFIQQIFLNSYYVPDMVVGATLKDEANLWWTQILSKLSHYSLWTVLRKIIDYMSSYTVIWAITEGTDLDNKFRECLTWNLKMLRYWVVVKGQWDTVFSYRDNQEHRWARASENNKFFQGQFAM